MGGGKEEWETGNHLVFLLRIERVGLSKRSAWFLTNSKYVTDLCLRMENRILHKFHLYNAQIVHFDFESLSTTVLV